MTKTKKNNVIKLIITAEDKKRWSNCASDDESPKIDAPKAIIQKIIGENTKIATPENGIISKIFTYEEADVLVILDENKKPWYKGISVCNILEYVASRNAISRHVSNKYKKSFADMMHNSTSQNGSLQKIDPRTTFINNTGLFQLIAHSKKPEAEKLWEYITEEILPTLFTTGTYILPPKESDIERLNKSFYNNHILNDYKSKSIVYYQINITYVHIGNIYLDDANNKN